MAKQVGDDPLMVELLLHFLNLILIGTNNNQGKEQEVHFSLQFLGIVILN